MSLLNKIEIEGDKNIVIQNISGGSNITVNIGNEKPELNILVMTSTLDEIKKSNSNLDVSHYKDYYGKELKDWKPFKNETLETIIKQKFKNLVAEPNIYFINCHHEITDEIKLAYFKLLRSRTIFIIDALALLNEYNQKLASLFDEPDSLLIIPTCINNQEIENNKFQIFKHLEIYTENFTQKALYFKLDEISKKSSFVREVFNIVTNKLKIKEKDLSLGYNVNNELD